MAAASAADWIAVFFLAFLALLSAMGYGVESMTGPRCRGMVQRVAMLVVLAALTACGGGSGGGGGQSSPATSSPEASVETLPVGPLDPGTYSYHFSGFDVVFTVDSGWSHLNEIPEAMLELVVGEEADPPVQAVGVFVTPEAAEDVPGLIEDIEGVTVTGTSDATLGGVPGGQIEYTVAEDAPEFTPVLGMGVPPQSEYGLFPGTTARVITVDVDGQTLVLAADAPTAEFEEFEPKAQGVIDSVEIQAG